MTPSVFNVRDFGATGNGLSLDTNALQRAIDAVAAAGGGTVWIPPGRYRVHSLRLVSHLTLQFSGGAELLAAAPPEPGQPGGYDAPEDGPPNWWQDFGHSRFKNSLLWGIDLHDVTLCGPGLIYGEGLSRGNGRTACRLGTVAPQPPGHLPDVLEADGDFSVEPRPDLAPGPFGYPNPRDTLPSGVGNKTLALLRCTRVRVRDLTFLHGGHFALLLTACRHVSLCDLLIDTNRDGIDIDGGFDIHVSRCSVNSPWDDGICLKSSCGSGEPVLLENVTVSDCFVSGFVEGTLYDGTRQRLIQHRGGPIGRIKLGTEGSGGYRNIAITNCLFEFCRGLALEQVDGGIMEDVVVSNLVMREVMNSPLFIRLGARGRGPGPGRRSSGTARRLHIQNVVAYDVAPEHGIFLAGLDGAPVEDVHLAHIQLHSRGALAGADPLREVPEMERDYPEPMLFGPLNAWGLWARHVKGLTVRDLQLFLSGPDPRPALWLDDVDDASLSGIAVQGAPDDARLTMRDVSHFQLQWRNGEVVTR